MGLFNRNKKSVYAKNRYGVIDQFSDIVKYESDFNSAALDAAIKWAQNKNNPAQLHTMRQRYNDYAQSQNAYSTRK